MTPREEHLKSMLEQSNQLIRAFDAVCDRKGESTNWSALSMMVRSVLAEQHKEFYPEQYISSPRAG